MLPLVGASLRLIAATVVAVLSAAVLVGVSDEAVDLPDGVVLVTALAILARTAIRTASEAPGRRRPRE